jgi:hypothetical protein
MNPLQKMKREMPGENDVDGKRHTHTHTHTHSPHQNKKTKKQKNKKTKKQKNKKTKKQKPKTKNHTENKAPCRPNPPSRVTRS